jgi:hypothetical protein
VASAARSSCCQIESQTWPVISATGTPRSRGSRCATAAVIRSSARSRRMVRSMPGRRIFTASTRPSRSRAR